MKKNIISILLFGFILVTISKFAYSSEIVIQPGTEDGMDVWITSYYDYDDDYGVNDHKLRVGGWADYYYSLLKFDLEGLPSNVTSAKIYLWCFYNGHSYRTSMQLDRVTSLWDESTGWYNKPSSEYLMGLSMPTLDTWYVIDITDLYKSWQNGTYQNYGIQLRPTNTWDAMNAFYSSDYMDNSSLRPKLVVEISKSITSVSITTGPPTVNENSSADYKAEAKFSDGTTEDVTNKAKWSVSPTTYASMDTTVKGRLKTKEVPSDQTVTVSASYTYNGTTKSGTKSVTIKNTSTSPTAYNYISYTSEKITLNMIKTDPNNIDFKNLNGKQNLSNSGYYGINGGYFYSGKYPCQIAVKNGVSICPSNGYDSTNPDLVPKNQWKGTGTIIWDGNYDWKKINMNRPNGRFFYPVIQKVDINTGSFYSYNNATPVWTVASKNNYWAQGGISMGLNNTNWFTQAKKNEGLVGPTRSTYRTGIVYDNFNKKVYLIVTNNNCTAETFRKAIINYINSQKLKINEMEGIFLDGSGSSQLKCKEKTLNGDSRKLVQIISLIK